MKALVRRNGALWGILAAAFGLRVWGVGFGAPYLSNFYIRPDESLIIQPAIELLEQHGNPGYFEYPALMSTLCALVFNLFHAAQSLLLPGSRTLAEHFAGNVTTYVILARLVSAVAGTLVVFSTWATARLLAGPGAALAAAALLAACPLAVRQSHFATTDTLMALLCLATLHRLIVFVQGRESKACGGGHLLAAATLFGLAVSAKYYAIVLLPVLLLTIGLERGVRLGLRMRRGLLVAVVSGAVFLAANVYLLFNLQTVIAWFGVLFHALYRSDHIPGASAWSPLGTLTNLLTPWRHGPGGFAGLGLAIAGVFIVLRTEARRTESALIVVACALLAAPLLPARVVPYRYLAPLLPLVAVLAGVGLARLGVIPKGRRWIAARMAVGVALVIPGLLTSARCNQLLARMDTRSLCGQWIRQHVPAETPVVFLGGPETEPQVNETYMSILRRVDFVNRLYGPKAGSVISKFYRLQLRNQPRTPETGYECFRNPEPAEVTARTICLVIPSYPLPSAHCAPGKAAAFLKGTPILQAEFTSLNAPAQTPVYELEPWDAFFLPYRPLFLVHRPGPHLAVWLIDRGKL
ncbi:MAG: glycosyltransferase family 39 protein [bacterium]